MTRKRRGSYALADTYTHMDHTVLLRELGNVKNEIENVKILKEVALMLISSRRSLKGGDFQQYLCNNIELWCNLMDIEVWRLPLFKVPYLLNVIRSLAHLIQNGILLTKARLDRDPYMFLIIKEEFYDAREATSFYLHSYCRLLETRNLINHHFESNTFAIISDRFADQVFHVIFASIDDGSGEVSRYCDVVCEC